MSQFIKLNRICVPLSLDCDLSCRYCYRHVGRIPVVPEFNDLMRNFLGQLDPVTTQALVASGGEPLLHFDKVVELFSYAHPAVHKKVMTNGLNLTQDIVDYLNANHIEVWVSHDGAVTEWLRGYDILNDDKLFELICKIEHLTFSCVCTAKNPDPYKCYQYIKERVPRHFYFHHSAVFYDKHLSANLTEGFDYRAFSRGSLMCALEDLDWHNPIPRHYNATSCNVLPNGDIVGMAEIHHKYGTVLDDIDTIIESRTTWGDLSKCEDTDCAVYNYCTGGDAAKSEHNCRIRATQIAILESRRERGND